MFTNLISSNYQFMMAIAVAIILTAVVTVIFSFRFKDAYVSGRTICVALVAIAIAIGMLRAAMPYSALANNPGEVISNVIMREIANTIQ